MHSNTITYTHKYSHTHSHSHKQIAVTTCSKPSFAIKCTVPEKCVVLKLIVVVSCSVDSQQICINHCLGVCIQWEGDYHTHAAHQLRRSLQGTWHMSSETSVTALAVRAFIIAETEVIRTNSLLWWLVSVLYSEPWSHTWHVMWLWFWQCYDKCSHKHSNFRLHVPGNCVTYSIENEDFWKLTTM